LNIAELLYIHPITYNSIDNKGTYIIQLIGLTNLANNIRGQNQTWLLGTLVYEAVKLETGERLV